MDEHYATEIAFKNGYKKGVMDVLGAIEFEIHNLDFDREETRAIAIEGVIANIKKEYTEEKA